MNDTRYVGISLLNQSSESGNGWAPLTIDGKPIDFLQRPLLDSFSAFVKSDDGVCVWRLTFFSGTGSDVGLSVSISDTLENAQRGGLAMAIWQQTNGGEPTPEQFSIASQWLRKSKSLTQDDYEERAGRWLSVDGGCFSMLSNALQRSTFERAVILLALACAYRVQFEELMNKLSKWAAGDTSQSNLQAKASRFNAQCYFRYPVKLSHQALPPVWDQFTDRFRLSELERESSGQIRALNDLIASETRDREQRRWQRITALLGVISAVQVLGLFSEETRHSWWMMLMAWIGVEQ